MTRITNDMLTDWFPSIVKPVHEGLYDTRMGHGDDGPALRRLWKDNNWWFNGQVVIVLCVVQQREWRGVTDEAHAALTGELLRGDI